MFAQTDTFFSVLHHCARCSTFKRWILYSCRFRFLEVPLGNFHH